jgi:hypothetical protein
MPCTAQDEECERAPRRRDPQGDRVVGECRRGCRRRGDSVEDQYPDHV